MGISPISIVEEMVKDIRDKSDIECNFYQSAEDVPDKIPVNRIMSEEDTATLIASI